MDVHEAAALTIIADYPDMPDEEFEEMLSRLESSEARRLAMKIRRGTSSTAGGGAADSEPFVRSAAASVG